jgi:hypothetical protein
MGISDTQLFDAIERRIIDGAEQGRNDREEKNEIALYIRALGFSGQSRYMPTLQKLSSDQLYGRQAKQALRDLPNYQKWNPIISDRANFNPQYSDQVNRILNMLHADDFLLKEIGAKRIYFSDKDAVLLAALADQVRAAYGRSGNDKETSDAIAWLVKALGSARQEQYLPLLREVAAGASDRKVVKYAKRALEYGR